jgi:hypothetical protein
LGLTFNLTEKEEDKMKKLFAVAAVFALVLVGCGDDGGNDSNDNKNETILTISNNSSRNFYSTRWNGTDFFNPYPYSNSGYIRSGDKLKAEVDPGNGYIYFTVYPWPNNEYLGSRRSGRTQELIIMEKGKSKTFVFIDSTVVVDGNNKTYTLLEFVSQ